MGSSRKLFLLLGILFAVVIFLSSSQVKKDQTTEHIDKKNGKVVHLQNTGQAIGYKPLLPGPVFPPKCTIYGQCLPRSPGIPKRRKCEYAKLCGRVPPKAQEFTKDQFKDDFHN